jgi:hypothetical protein
MGAALQEDGAESQLAAMAGLRSASAVDLKRPIRALMVRTGEKTTDLVWVLAVAKPAEIKREITKPGLEGRVQDGWVAIGPRVALDQVAPYALSVLARRPTRPPLTATILMTRVLAAYEAQFRESLRQAGATAPAGFDLTRLFSVYFDLARSLDRVEAVLDLSSSGAGLTFDLIPLPGSRLRAFAQAQHAASYEQLARFPAEAGAIVGAWDLVLQPFAGDAAAWVREFMGAMTGAESGKAIAEVTERLVHAMTGQGAIAFASLGGGDVSRLKGSYLISVEDGAKAQAIAIDAWKAMDGVSFFGARAKIVVRPDEARHGDVRLAHVRTEYDLSQLPHPHRQALEKTMKPQDLWAAGFDRSWGVSIGQTARMALGAMIDAARSGAPAERDQRTKALLEESRRRRESAVVIIGFDGFLGDDAPPAAKMMLANRGLAMVLGAGFEGTTTRFRMTLATPTAF